jgi:hypothetical protein
MTSSLESPHTLTDADLIVRVRALARDERRATVQLIAGLAEFERRQLYLSQGCASLFTYCTDVLHFSEHAAYARMEVARTALRFPVVLERLEDGALTLTTIRRLGPVLTEANHRDVLTAATHKKKGDIELLVATLRPRSDAATIVRKLPTPRASGLVLQPAPALCAPSHPVGPSTDTATPQPAVLDSPVSRSASPPPIVSPLASERYRIQFTASRAMHDKLRLVQALIRHRIPTGDPAAIFERGLDLLLADLSRTKFAAATYPRNQPTLGGALPPHPGGGQT